MHQNVVPGEMILSMLVQQRSSWNVLWKVLIFHNFWKLNPQSNYFCNNVK